MLRDRLLTRDRNDRRMLASAMAVSLVVASVVISMSAAIANPYTLKCTTAAGDPAADLNRRSRPKGDDVGTVTQLQDHEGH